MRNGTPARSAATRGRKAGRPQTNDARARVAVTRHGCRCREKLRRVVRHRGWQRRREWSRPRRQRSRRQRLQRGSGGRGDAAIRSSEAAETRLTVDDGVMVLKVQRASAWQHAGVRCSGRSGAKRRVPWRGNRRFTAREGRGPQAAAEWRHFARGRQVVYRYRKTYVSETW